MISTNPKGMPQMPQTTTDEHHDTVTDRVLAATTHLLLERGSRKLRTAEIADRSQTTESTLFRHLKSLERILELTYSRCWALINRQVGAAAFDRPFVTDPMQALLCDTAAVWEMKNDPARSDAATVAFLFLRRRAEILNPDSQPCPDELRFQLRIERVVRSIIVNRAADGQANDHQVELLTTLIMNYMATVWLTWFCMPLHSDDVTARHDLSAEEAQLGIIVLVDRVTSGAGGVQHVATGDNDS